MRAYATATRSPRHGFPVFSTGLALTGASKERPGAVGRPATVGDVAVEPGDWIVGDVDGVVVLPGAALDVGARRGPRPCRQGSRPVRGAARWQHHVAEFGLDAGLIDGA